MTVFRAILATAALAVFAGTAQAAPEKPVSLKDPAVFIATLKDMGYKPEPLQKDTKLPTFLMDVEGTPTDFTFGGCTAQKDCTYLYMSSSFTDVPNPPADWITKMNDTFDIIKVGLNSDKFLYFSEAHVIEGLPRATLRNILTMWSGDANGLGDEAIKAKLNKK